MFKKILFISGLFFFTFHFVHTQELLIKDKKILINGVESFEIKKDEVVRNSFYLNTIDGKQLLYFRYVYWANNKPSYYEAYNANDIETILFEEEYRGNFKRYIAKKLFHANVISPSGINEKKLKIVVQKIGKEFSRRRDNNYQRNQ